MSFLVSVQGRNYSKEAVGHQLSLPRWYRKRKIKQQSCPTILCILTTGQVPVAVILKSETEFSQVVSYLYATK